MDTIRINQFVHDTLYIKGAEGLDVLSKTDSFYNNAWNRLIIFWAVLAIIVPAVITWFQKQTLKTNSDELKKEIKEEISKAQNELKVEIRDELNLELQKHEQLIELQKNRSNAGIYFLQGLNYINNAKYALAFFQFLKCALACEKSHTQELKKVLDNMIIKCLPNLSVEELQNKRYPNWEKQINDLFDRLSQREDMNFVHQTILTFKSMLSTLPKTKVEREQN